MARSRATPAPSRRSSLAKRMSRARLRALLRADISANRWCGRKQRARPAASGLDPAQVGRVASVDLDLLAGGQEERDLALVAGLGGGSLGAARGAIALQAGVSVGGTERHRGLQLDHVYAPQSGTGCCWGGIYKP